MARSIGVAVNVILDFPPEMIESDGSPRPGDAARLCVEGTLTVPVGGVDAFLTMTKPYRSTPVESTFLVPPWARLPEPSERAPRSSPSMGAT